MRTMGYSIKGLDFVLITDRKVCGKKLTDIIEQAIDGGVGTVQLREKDLNTGDLVWAFDEVFNVGNPRVNNSLRRYMRTQRMTHMDIFRDSLVIDSPRVLARYSLTTALETMRKKKPKVVQETADNTSSR